MINTKFRGKSLMPTVDLNYLNIEHDNGWVFGTYIDGYIINDVIEANDEYITIGNWVPVDNVGQYTGLKDQEGVEVYFNDIVEDKYGHRYEVVFEGDCLRCNGVSRIRGGHKPKNRWFGRDLKIIGNIYENSDLI